MLTFATLLLALAPQTEPELALKGLDPVALCESAEIPGEPGLVADHGRYRYRFVSEESLATFREDPARWGIQWGGGCGRMGPLSGRGAPTRWAVVDERIYIFASDGCREGFLSDTKLFLAEAAGPRQGDADAGREWIEKAVVAHGGAQAIDAATALRLTSEKTSSDWLNELELLVAVDGSVRRGSTWTPPTEDQTGFDTVWVSSAGKAFTVESGVTFDLLSEHERADVRRFAHREVLTLLWARTRSDFAAVHITGNEVDVTFDGLTTTLHLGDDGTVLGLTWTGRLNDGVTREVKETFTEWTTVDGVRLPAARTVAKGGKESAEGPWTVELLPAPPAKAFQRP